MIKRDKCKQGHDMKDPNLIHKTVRGRAVRECRTCANARFTKMRKDKKTRNKSVDNISDETFNGEQPSVRDDQPKDDVEEIVSEEKQQPGAEQAAVDPMEFLEDAAPLKIVPITDWGGKDEDDPGDAQDYAVVDASDPRYATGGVFPPGDPVIVGEAAFDCHVERIPPSLREQAFLEVGGTRKADGTINVTEVSIVETLHAPHGTPVAPPAPKVRPRIGCEHGFNNPAICPSCRSGRGR